VNTYASALQLLGWIVRYVAIGRHAYLTREDEQTILSAQLDLVAVSGEGRVDRSRVSSLSHRRHDNHAAASCGAQASRTPCAATAHGGPALRHSK
jgi:hypothetical protein